MILPPRVWLRNSELKQCAPTGEQLIENSYWQFSSKIDKLEGLSDLQKDLIKDEIKRDLENLYAGDEKTRAEILDKYRPQEASKKPQILVNTPEGREYKPNPGFTSHETDFSDMIFEKGIAVSDEKFQDAKARGKVVYQDADYHHAQSKGLKSPAPKDPAAALDSSIKITETSGRRIGVDKKNKEFVIFDPTLEKPDGTIEYHGHARIWDELHQDQKTILRKKGIVNKKGGIKDE